MAKKKQSKKGPISRDLLRALDIITEGAGAPLPESMTLEAVEAHKAARPWSMGKDTQGVGIGAVIRDSVQLRELAIKVYVKKKLPKSKVQHLVPPCLELPGIEAPVPTDVEEIGQVVAEMNTGRVRPAVPGYGVGHPSVTVGTFGCLVRRRGGTTLYILSNSHVLADEGVAKKGVKILQPGRSDGGRAPGDVIGTLEDWVPFAFSNTGFPNLVDAAIARVKKSDVTSAIKVIGVPARLSTVVRRGMRVQKSGRTTQYTVGVIKDVHYRLALRYKRPGGGRGRVGLRDQVLCTRYTAGGDSGSAVLNMSKKVVGLHFAGSPSTSIFNKMRHVLDLLDVDIVTSRI